MKKETKKYGDTETENETENKIPKGFELMTSNKNSYHETVLAIRKSIIDKRVNDVFNYCEFWSHEDKLKAKKILIEGVNDEKRN